MITPTEQNDHQRDNRSKEEIEECVEFVRLELYNRGLACGLLNGVINYERIGAYFYES